MYMIHWSGCPVRGQGLWSEKKNFGLALFSCRLDQSLLPLLPRPCKRRDPPDGPSQVRRRRVHVYDRYLFTLHSPALNSCSCRVEPVNNPEEVNSDSNTAAKLVKERRQWLWNYRPARDCGWRHGCLLPRERQCAPGCEEVFS